MSEISSHKTFNHRDGNLIQILLLKNIFEKPSYGYEIIENLKKNNVFAHKLKTGTVYTLLRRMEKRGFISSEWLENDKKPNKRVYTITEDGIQFLKIWLEFIIQRKNIINKLTRFYNKSFKTEESHLKDK